MTTSLRRNRKSDVAKVTPKQLLLLAMASSLLLWSQGSAETITGPWITHTNNVQYRISYESGTQCQDQLPYFHSEYSASYHAVAAVTAFNSNGHGIAFGKKHNTHDHNGGCNFNFVFSPGGL